MGSSPLVIRLLKGIFNRRHSLPRNNITWDPEVILRFLKTLSPVKNLSLLQLSQKTVALLLLLTGQRGQSIHVMDLRNIDITKNHVKIRFGDLLKTTRPGYQQKELTIKAYAPDRRLCIVTVLTEYINRTKDLRQDDGLFIATVKPHRKISTDTILRWFKVVMDKAGLDLAIFTPHSARAASTSAAVRAKIPLHSILETAGRANSSTFRKYYEKPVDTNNCLDIIRE